MRFTVILLALLAALPVATCVASEEHGMHRNYVTAPPSPRSQSPAQAQAKSTGCVSCHTSTDSASMHGSEGVNLGCTDCHGGTASVLKPTGADDKSAAFAQARDEAHVLPTFPERLSHPAAADRRLPMVCRRACMPRRADSS